MWTALDLPVKMRDGVCLSADAYLPAGDSAFPVLLCRTPYNKQMAMYVDWAFRFVESGFGVVIQDCRGRYASDGQWTPYVDEAQDGADTVTWVSEQPWCSGKIGMFGISYVGFTQLLASLGGNDHLTALVPIGCQEDNFGHLWVDGVMQLQNLVNFFQIGRRTMNTETADRLDLAPVYERLPVDEALQGVADCDPFHEFLAHPTFDEFWRSYSLKGRYDDIRPAVMLVTGWYDNLVHEQFKIFRGLTASRGDQSGRHPVRIVVGPWTHFDMGARMVADVDFGPEAEIDMPALQIEWFQPHLGPGSEHETQGHEDEAPIRLFVMGENRWRSEWEWPLARTEWTPVYLAGPASPGASGSGILSWDEGQDSSTEASEFRYDPMHPVPTWGGQSMFMANTGPRDRAHIEQRADVLLFTTDPLQEGLEVTGPARLEFYASSEAPDTDFTAALVDVDQDGHSTHITEGIVRARYRSSVTLPEPITPGEVVKYRLELWETSVVFAPGHRIGLEISSSNFPRFDRNLNTAAPIGHDASWRVAHQRVFHSGSLRSRLILPVIPRP